MSVTMTVLLIVYFTINAFLAGKEYQDKLSWTLPKEDVMIAWASVITTFFLGLILIPLIFIIGSLYILTQKYGINDLFFVYFSPDAYKKMSDAGLGNINNPNFLDRKKSRMKRRISIHCINVMNKRNGYSPVIATEESESEVIGEPRRMYCADCGEYSSDNVYHKIAMHRGNSKVTYKYICTKCFTPAPVASVMPEPSSTGTPNPKLHVMGTDYDTISRH